MMKEIEQLFFEITDKCNLKCKTCFEGTAGCNELCITQVIDVIDKFLPYGLHSVVISGGEPFLHSEIDRFITYAKNVKVIQFLINTNGTIISDAQIELINSCDNVYLQLSLDGSNEEINALNRGKGNFDKVISCINKLDSERIRNINCVVTNFNKNDIGSFYDLCEGLSVSCNITVVANFGNASINSEELIPKDVELVNLLSEINGLHEKHGSSNRAKLCLDDCAFARKDSVCIYIRTNGDIYPCLYMHNEVFAIGNIEKIDYDSIQREFERVISIIQRRRQYIGNCKCILNSICKKGCIAKAYGSGNKPDIRDGQCDIRRKYIIDYISKRKAHDCLLYKSK